MNQHLLSILIKNENHILLARQQAKRIAELLHFDVIDQSRISTATSELARDMVLFTSGGEIQFLLKTETNTHSLNVVVRTNDPAPLEGIAAALEGRGRIRSDQGMGFVNAKRLMDLFSLKRDTANNLQLYFGKQLNPGIAAPEFNKVLDQIKTIPLSTSVEIHEFNQEFVRTLEVLNQRQEEIYQLTMELEETNRGVVALYAELDEKAESIKKADQLKSRFLSHMSHEFRTPLSSIMGLSKLLLNRVDGDLTSEQEKQVKFILSASQGLLELVNDLLDLAKIEAGKIEVHPTKFTVAELIGALRGMFRPIQSNPRVTLIFDEINDCPALFTDEAKLSQILRNFISNALKFTEAGEIRVSADFNAVEITFAVSDTGIGIAEENQRFLFQEFSQLDSPLHKKTKGSGLGLALCKKLAELLGGNVYFKSETGKGSIFFVNIPIEYGVAAPEPPSKLPMVEKDKKVVLIVDDDDASRYLVKTWFANLNFSLFEASSGIEGISIATEKTPDLIVLDLNMPGMSGFEMLRILKNDPRLANIPVVINSSKVLDGDERDFLQSRAAAILRKEDQSPEKALDIIQDILAVNQGR
jgi:signal transduction histidine kinase/CheY-like chemotaxis protein